jgi:hypothetical protein
MEPWIRLPPIAGLAAELAYTSECTGSKDLMTEIPLTLGRSQVLALIHVGLRARVIMCTRPCCQNVNPQPIAMQ